MTETGPAESEVVLPLNDLAERPAPVATDADGHSLLCVSRCRACGRDYLPARPRCLACGGTQFDDARLPGRGTLYSFSTVHVSSSRAVPYTIGYVDVNEGLRVLADIQASPESLCCDLPVQLVQGAQSLSFTSSGSRA